MLVSLHPSESADGGPTVDLSLRPLTIGRSPDNLLVIANVHVSWHHAVVRSEGKRVWIKDLGSSNGTWVNGERVRGRALVRDGDEILMGPEFKMSVNVTDHEPTLVPRADLLLEDQASGLRFAVHGRKLSIGSALDADICLEELPPHAATVSLQDARTILLEMDGEEHMLEAGDSVELGSRELLVVSSVPSRTVTTQPSGFPFELDVTLNGREGPEAVLFDPVRRFRYPITAGNRVVLLYLLGRRLSEDRKSARTAADQGWCTDAEIMTGIWGRNRGNRDTNSLHVLVYRLRRELEQQGFNPACIEKRKKRLRFSVAKVRLT